MSVDLDFVDGSEVGPVGAMIIVIALIAVVAWAVYSAKIDSERVTYLQDHCAMVKATQILVIDDGDEEYWTRYTYNCKDSIVSYDVDKRDHVKFR